MVAAGRRRSIAFFIALGACLVALAVTLNVSWIIISWRTGLLFVLGIVFFSLIITGVVLNTIFLVREIRRNEQHDSFINAVTHELKTPVASMRLYLQTLDSREVEPAKRKEFYRIMLEDNDRLMNTIDQVLRAGRSTARRKLLHRSAVDVREVADECVSLGRKRHHLTEAELRLCDELNGESAVVTGDPEELQAAVANLIDNAVKYSREKPDIDVYLRRQEGRVDIRVRDHGVGIPANELKRIWNRFYRVPGAIAARVKGTGLGLFIVRGVAEKHGGKAFAESDGAGKGSTFTIQLPLAQRR